VSDRRRRYRPALECLEDRYLPSAGFAQVNLASDVPGLASVTDPHLANPWGVAFSPTGPFWFADNGSGVSDLLDGRGQLVPLVVTVPAGTPTGTVFNGGDGFVITANGVSAPSRFLFAAEDGTIAGWTSVVDPTHAFRVVDDSSRGAVYRGLALADDAAGHSFLYAADFSRGTIDVFDRDFRPVVRPGAFHDPNLPDGFVPFNIQNINDLLFVAYAQQNEDGGDDVAGAGLGFLDVYDTDGNLVRRFASGGALNAPWGLALAPADFGPFGGALLVGNNGDGHINACDARSGTFLGALADDHGMPIVVPDLWALTFGNGHAGGDAHTLFFTAGLDYEAHGLFGAIQAPGRHGADTGGLLGGFDDSAAGEPGDYPLPPSGGPALEAGNEDPRLPTSDLLPLREASLALAPTLSTIVQPGTRIEAAVPARRMVRVSWSAALGTAVSTSNTLLPTPLPEDSLPAGGVRDDAVALNTLLDLHASHQVPQQLDTNLDAADGGNSPSPARNAPDAALLAEVYLDKLEFQPRDAGPAVPVPSRPADPLLAAIPSASRATPGDKGRGVRGESVAAKDGGGSKDRCSQATHQQLFDVLTGLKQSVRKRLRSLQTVRSRVQQLVQRLREKAPPG
jgi:uncharacterized protein (TIGR03118 family)